MDEQTMKRWALLDEKQTEFFKSLNKPRIGYMDCKAMSEAREVCKEKAQAAFQDLRKLHQQAAGRGLSGLRLCRDGIDALRTARDAYAAYRLAHHAYITLFARYMRQIANDALAYKTYGTDAAFGLWMPNTPAND